MVADLSEPGLEVTRLPVGFERFHRRAFLNYQFNRTYGLGFADLNDLHGGASLVRVGSDCEVCSPSFG